MAISRQDVLSNIRCSIQDLQDEINKLESRDDLTLIDIIGIRIAIQRVTNKVENM